MLIQRIKKKLSQAMLFLTQGACFSVLTLQAELADFLVDSARFYGCQFIISTHSPFLLAMRGARIYDLDGGPVGVRKWTELPNVRLYFEFFEARRGEFLG